MVKVADEALSEQAIKNKRRYIKKEPRNILMSHRAYLLFKAMADKRDVGIGDFFELLSQEVAEQRLSEAERQSVLLQAQQIIDARMREIVELELGRKLAEQPT